MTALLISLCCLCSQHVSSHPSRRPSNTVQRSSHAITTRRVCSQCKLKKDVWDLDTEMPLQGRRAGHELMTAFFSFLRLIYDFFFRQCIFLTLLCVYVLVVLELYMLCPLSKMRIGPNQNFLCKRCVL